MEARSLIVELPDRIRGRGQLVRTGDGDWFEPPSLIPLNFNRAAPIPSGHAVRVEGADFDTVASRHEQDGVVTGNVTIYGRWLGDRIRVDRHTLEASGPSPPLLRNPPGPAPPGGWPVSPDGDDPDDVGFVDVDHLEKTGAATSIAVFRPGPKQAVLVVAAVDVAAVEAQLRARLRARLCVVASRWTREQLDGVTRYLWERAQPWGVYRTGRTCDEQGQTIVNVKLVRVTAIAAWAETQPAELVVLEPWLAPIGVDDH